MRVLLKYTCGSVWTLLAFFAFWFISCYSFDVHATQLVAYSITFNIVIYKITKIVRALWLAERSVCMRVCKHGCGIKMFCFSRANHVSTNLKKFLSSKLDKVTLFTHSFVGWNLENLYKQAVSTFFQILSEKNPYFGKHLFAKQELITRARLRV